MSSIDPTEAQLAAFASAPLQGPIVMVNLLRFAPGGAASYAKYGAAVGPLLKEIGGRVVFQSSGKGTLIGPDAWDQVLLVEYPSRDKFLEMIRSEAYQKAVPLRSAALADSRLYCTQAG